MRTVSLVQAKAHFSELVTQVADVAPVDGIGVVTKVVIGKLLQSSQLGVDGGGAGKPRATPAVCPYGSRLPPMAMTGSLSDRLRIAWP